jgi:hypothetical protein
MKNKHEDKQATVAPGMEMDELEVSANQKDVEEDDYTRVTKLVIDRVPEEE